MTAQVLFDYYNQRYWQGRLPRVRIRRRLKKGIRALLDKDQVGSCPYPRLPFIWLHPALKGRALKCVLLHEMAHLAAGWNGRGHNELFFEEVCCGPKYFIRHECGNDETTRFVEEVFRA